MKIEIIMTGFSIILQLFIIYYSFKMIRVALYLNNWKIGWIHFLIAAVLVTGRRVMWIYEYYVGESFSYPLESVLTVFSSACLLWFIYSMKIVFEESHESYRDKKQIPVLSPNSDLEIRIDALDGRAIDLELKIKDIKEREKENISSNNELELKIDALDDKIIELAVLVKDIKINKIDQKIVELTSDKK